MKRLTGFIGYLSFLTISMMALPTPPRLDELVHDSDYIARVKLIGCKQTKVSGNDISVTCKGEVMEAYKTIAPLPGRMDIGFMVLPEKYGKWLKAVPKEGEYILHFINRVSSDPSGTPRNLIVLYEPHPFAIHEYSKEYESKIRNALK
jgi:hypothetical protein